MCCFVNDKTSRGDICPMYFVPFIDCIREIVLETKILLKQHKLYVDTRNSLNASELTYHNLLMANVNIDVLQQVTN